MAAAGSAVTALSTALSSLTTGQLLHLGGLITQTNEMKAMQILSMMSMNPAGAPGLLTALEIIPNLPPEVITWASTAISNPSQFAQNMAMATAALQRAPVSVLNVPSLFGN